MSNFKIVEVPHEEFSQLKEHLEKDWKRTFLVHSAIHIILTKGELKKSKLRVFRANDPNYLSFLFITPIFNNDYLQSMSITWDTDEITDEEVGHLCSSIPEFNWNKPYISMHNSFEMRSRFLDLFMAKKIIANKISLIECCDRSHGVLMTVTKEDLKSTELPPGYELGRLTTSAATSLHSKWDNNYVEDLEGVIERIVTYEGVAAFYRNDDDETNQTDNFVAGTQQYNMGMIGMTFTLPEHRRKGLGAAVTIQMAKQIIEERRYVFVVVAKENHDSIEFHKRVGFKIIGDCGFSLFLPGTTQDEYDTEEKIKDYLLSHKFN